MEMGNVPKRQQPGMFVTIRHTVNSLLFVGYQFSWISWVQVNYEIVSSTNDQCSMVYTRTWAKPKDQISKNTQVFPYPQKLVHIKINESRLLFTNISVKCGIFKLLILKYGYVEYWQRDNYLHKFQYCGSKQLQSTV